MDTAVPFQPWALLADSSSGSTWVNHVLSSHPCAVSQGEYLMTNKTAAALFHQSPEGIAAVLRDVAARNRDALSRRASRQPRRHLRLLHTVPQYFNTCAGLHQLTEARR